MVDNSLGREVVRSIYIVRSLLMLVFMILLVISFKLHAPFDRMIVLILDLQLMNYLCLLHVTIPSNVVIASQIFRPFVNFHMLKLINISGRSIYEREEELEFLGQRMTFGYSTFETFKNMETLGLVFFLYLTKCIVTLFVYCFRKKNTKINIL